MPWLRPVTSLRYFDGDLLVLSAALSVQLPKVADAIAAVRRTEDRPLQIMVGGLAFSEAPASSARMAWLPMPGPQ